jgi:hypothetical protein
MTSHTAFLCCPAGATSLWLQGRVFLLDRSSHAQSLSLVAVQEAQPHECLTPPDGSRLTFDVGLVDHAADAEVVVEGVVATGGSMVAWEAPEAAGGVVASASAAASAAAGGGPTRGSPLTFSPLKVYTGAAALGFAARMFPEIYAALHLGRGGEPAAAYTEALEGADPMGLWGGEGEAEETAASSSSSSSSSASSGAPPPSLPAAAEQLLVVEGKLTLREDMLEWRPHWRPPRASAKRPRQDVAAAAAASSALLELSSSDDDDDDVDVTASRRVPRQLSEAAIAPAVAPRGTVAALLARDFAENPFHPSRAGGVDDDDEGGEGPSPPKRPAEGGHGGHAHAHVGPDEGAPLVEVGGGWIETRPQAASRRGGGGGGGTG